MRTIIATLAGVVVSLFALSAAAQSPSWTGAQTEVWEAVEQSWVDDVAENGKWPAEYVHDDYVAWGDDMAAPRYRDEAIAWSRFGDQSSETLIYEISPAAITVAGDTAIAYYHVTTVTESVEGKREQNVSRITEILVRDGDEWKWLGGVSFDPRLND